VLALSLVELGGFLRSWAKGGAKMDQKYNCVIQKVTNVHQGKVKEQNKSEWNSRSHIL